MALRSVGLGVGGTWRGNCRRLQAMGMWIALVKGTSYLSSSSYRRKAFIPVDSSPWGTGDWYCLEWDNELKEIKDFGRYFQRGARLDESR